MKRSSSLRSSSSVPASLLALSLLVANTACGPHLQIDTLQTMNMSAQYFELARLLESMPPWQNLSNFKLVLLCTTYSKLKNYNKLFSCLDEIDRRVLKGDRYANPMDDAAEESTIVWILSHDDGVRMSQRSDISAKSAQLRSVAYLELGNYSQAVIEAEKFYAEFQKLDRPPRLRNQIHELFKSEDDKRLRSRLEMNGKMIEEPLPLLVVSYALKGDRQKAQEVAEQMRILNVKEDFPWERNIKRLVLARVYLAIGDYERAYQSISSLEKGGCCISTPQWKEAGLFFKEQWLERGFILAKCLYELGQVEKGKQAYDTLLAQPALRDVGDLHWVVLYNRGQIAEKDGLRSQGIGFYKQAIDVIEHQRSTITTEVSRIGFVGDKQQVYHRLVSALIAAGQSAQAFEYVERAKARALVDLLASKQDFAAAIGASQETVSLIKEWEQAEAESRKSGLSSEESGRRSARGVQVKANLRAVSPELASLVMVTETASSASRPCWSRTRRCSNTTTRATISMPSWLLGMP